MEKFLWNVSGFILLVANVFVLIMTFASNDKIWAFILLSISILDWVYSEKRPTWLEV